MNPSTRGFGEAPVQAGENPEIPVLREKEKEKKGAGIPLFTGSGPGSTLNFGLGGQVVRVGTSLHPPMGFLGSGRIAAALSNLFGGSGTFLGGLFASQWGAPLVLGGLLSWAGVLAGGWVMLRQGLGGSQGPSMNSSAFLPGVGDSGLVIDKPKDRSLGYVAGANRGEIAWNEEHPLAPKEVKEAPKDEPSKPEPPPLPDLQELLAKQQKGLDATRDKFITQLTKDPAQLRAGLPSGLGGEKRLKDGGGFALKKTFSDVTPKTSKVAGFGRQLSPLSVRKMNTLSAKANRAVGQLKFGNIMSQAGRFTAEDTLKREYAANAFDGQMSTGGDGISGLGQIALPPGAGITSGDGVTNPGPPRNVTPYQPNVDSARNLGDTGGMLKGMGVAMMLAGLALIATGMSLLGNPLTAPIGAALIGAGTALVATGLMMMAMAAMMGKMAEGQAKKVGEADKQREQQEATNDCVRRAIAAGRKTSEMCPQMGGPATTTSRASGGSVQEDVWANSPDNPNNNPRIGR